jgi:hypothetical protein
MEVEKVTSELTTEQRERIADFVAALRSGEYEQTLNQLGKVNDGCVKTYCCEGVAVERYADDVGYHSRWSRGNLVLIDHDDNEGVDYADDDFWEALALNTHPDNGTSTTFAFILPQGLDVRDTGAVAIAYMALNDDGLTFAQIADLIEWQFLSCPVD